MSIKGFSKNKKEPGMKKNLTAIFSNLKENLEKALKGTEDSVKRIAVEIAGISREIDLKTDHPGGELVKKLYKPVYKMIKDTASKGGDLQITARGIVIGIFRASNKIRQEAHQTIGLIASIIIKATSKAGGNLRSAAKGIIEGFTEVAKEQNLNKGEVIAKASACALETAHNINPDSAKKVRRVISEKVNGAREALKKTLYRDKKLSRKSGF